MTQRHPIQNEYVMFVTTNIKDRMTIFSHDPYAREAIKVLYRVQKLYPFTLYGFVIMPDHCHFLIEIPTTGSVSHLMNRFKMGVSHSLGLGPIWQPRFYLKLSNNAHRILHYIHMNPVKAGLVDSAECYPWSSASGRWDITEIDW